VPIEVACATSVLRAVDERRRGEDALIYKGPGKADVWLSLGRLGRLGVEQVPNSAARVIKSHVRGDIAHDGWKGLSKCKLMSPVN